LEWNDDEDLPIFLTDVSYDLLGCRFVVWRKIALHFQNWMPLPAQAA
jgi:hypothetical protein